MQMLVTPGKQDLQDCREVRQGGMAVHQHATPDEWANAAQDDAELVDTEWCSSGGHALRVAQSIRPLKGSPRYLTLSTWAAAIASARGAESPTQPQVAPTRASVVMHRSPSLTAHHTLGPSGP